MEISAITALANQIAPMILPYLPALLQGAKLAEDVVTAVGRKLGEVDWDTALKIWEKLKPQVKEKPEVERRMAEVAEKQEDPRAETMLSWELEKVLKALQPEQLTEIQNIITKSKTEVRTTIASGDRSVSVGGDASRATIITGNHSKTGDAPSDQNQPKDEE